MDAPRLEQHLPEYPFVDDPAIYDAVSNREEFKELTLAEKEPTPIRNRYLMSQQIIGRLGSIYSPIDGILSYHKTGSGKTGEMLSLCTKYLYHNGKRASVKPVLYIVRGKETLAGVLYDNIVKLEPMYSENPPRRDEGEPIEKYEKRVRHNIRAKINRDYEIVAFENFTRRYQEFPDDVVASASNRLIMFDEAHRIITSKSTKEDADNKSYRSIHSLLHRITGSKIMLFTATPVKDYITEFPKLMNLILPLDQQLPTDIEFLQNFIVWDDANPMIINGREFRRGRLDQDKLEPYLRGRVSYLKSPPSAVEVVNRYQNLSGSDTKDFQLRMSSFQWKAYLKAVEADHVTTETKLGGDEEEGAAAEPDDSDQGEDDAGKKNGLLSNAHQACEFVFPDGSWGKTGYNKYIITNDKTGARQFSAEFMKYINKSGSTPIEQIRRLSAKYADAIEYLLANEKGIHFMYSFYVTGSGLTVFVLLLTTFFEYSLYKYKEGDEGLLFGGTHKRRVVYLNAESKKDALLSRINHIGNVDGHAINLVIGSKTASEGVTIKNTTSITMFQWWWNSTQHYQAISRGIRQFAHTDLLAAYEANEAKWWDGTVKVTRYTAIPPRQVGNNETITVFNTTIDGINYYRSEVKEQLMTSLEEVIKNLSIDFELTKRRNFTDVPERNIDSVDPVTQKDPSLTKRLLFLSTEIEKLMPHIKKWIVESNIMTYESLLKRVAALYPQHDVLTHRHILLSAAELLIENHIPIQTFNGKIVYLHEHNNNFFVTSSISESLIENVIYNTSRFVEIVQKAKPVSEEDTTAGVVEKVIDGSISIDEFGKVATDANKIEVALRTRHYEGSPQTTPDAEQIKALREHFDYAFTVLPKGVIKMASGADEIEVFIGSERFLFWTGTTWEPLRASDCKIIKEHIRNCIVAAENESAYRGVIGHYRPSASGGRTFGFKFIKFEKSSSRDASLFNHYVVRVVLSNFEIEPSVVYQKAHGTSKSLPKNIPSTKPTMPFDEFVEKVIKGYRPKNINKEFLHDMLKSPNQRKCAYKWFDTNFVRENREQDAYNKLFVIEDLTRVVYEVLEEHDAIIEYIQPGSI